MQKKTENNMYNYHLIIKNNYHINTQVKKYNIAVHSSHIWLPDHSPRGNCPTNSSDSYFSAFLYSFSLAYGSLKNIIQFA